MSDNVIEATETPAQEIARLRAEVAAFKAQQERQAKLGNKRLVVGGKGQLSIYGLRRFPIHLYVGEMAWLLNNQEAILDFMKENKAKLSVKEE